MPDFTFVTYSAMPDLDPDDRLAVRALEERGSRVASAVWDDPAVDWSKAGICVIRSTWDYNLRRDRFLAWAESVASVTRLFNSPALVRWNSHKSYLQDLGERGIPIVPTRWLRSGTNAKLRQVLEEQNWQRAVVKPAVGLATYGVKAVVGDEQGQAHLDSLLREHDVMVQPYLESVDAYGERALVFIDSTYSHAVRKTAFQALLPAGEAGETPVEASAAEIAVGVSAMKSLPERALYGRVDLVRGADGEPLIIELELVEPTLFLSMHPRAAQRFADALMSLLSQGRERSSQPGSS
jgi:glutathione synthase/RimK-type ligase-like ATP-grasp enzyme